MHIIFRLLACFVGFSAFLTISVAQATDYYVSTSGNDSNAGTQAAPFRTIQKGSEVAQAGDTVHVLPGTYIETRKGSNFAGIQQRNKGTASNRIRFVSDTRWGAKVSTRGTTTTMWAVMGDYVDIEGFEVDGTDANAGPGIMLYGDKGRILYNHVHHILPPACHGAIGIDSGDYNGSGSEVIGNLIHDTKPNVTPCNLSGYAIYFASPNGKVMNNIIYNTMLHGIHLWHAPYGTVVSHNLIFNAHGKSGIVFGCNDAPYVQCHNITVSNNIIMNSDFTHAIIEYGNNDSSNLVTHNIIFGNGSGDIIKMQTGTAKDNMIGVNPMIPGLSGGDYHLASGSPAIDAGTTQCVSASSCVPSEDFWQSARPFAAGYDIGPHESGSTPGSAPPLIPPTGAGTAVIGGAGAGGSGAGTGGGLSNCAR